MLPMAVPGMVLASATSCFNMPSNPLNFLYGTMAILRCRPSFTFYSSSHLTAVTALSQIDGEFESASASLKVPFYRTSARYGSGVPSIVAGHRTLLFRQCDDDDFGGGIPVLAEDHAGSDFHTQLDEAGAIGSAAAMATLIVLTSAAVTAALFAIEWWLIRRTQAWRNTAQN
jgi:iron(III) transport system permease protein